jgi:3-hydroxyisobutyrate dehydrogenase-like beta-hydroxyacid dehydrogenase
MEGADADIFSAINPALAVMGATILHCGQQIVARKQNL